MTLTKYIKELQKLEAAGHGKCKVVYASDDEGNSFGEVHHTPSIGKFDGCESFVSEDNFEDWGYEGRPNAICLN